jgi:hypothetical protein
LQLRPKSIHSLFQISMNEIWWQQLYMHFCLWLLYKC